MPPSYKIVQKRTFIFHDKRFQLPFRYQGRKITENTYMYSGIGGFLRSVEHVVARKLLFVLATSPINSLCNDESYGFVQFLLPWVPLVTINSLRSSDTYMCQQPRPPLADNGLSPVGRQAIIWTNAVLLSIGPLGTISIKLYSKFKYFHSRKCISKCRLENVGHFVSAWMC